VAITPAANADRMEKICSMAYCSRVQSPQGSRGTDSNISLFKAILQQTMKIRYKNTTKNYYLVGRSFALHIYG